MKPTRFCAPKCYLRPVLARPHPLPRASRRPRGGCLLPASLILCAGCGEDYGTVTLSWQIVDRNGDRIYPRGLLDRDARRDACGLSGFTSAGDTTYDFGVQLEICDPACPQGCDDPACLVKPPLHFSCETFRGTDMEVPSSEDPYLFFLRPALDIAQRELACTTPAPWCISVPGPRERTLSHGLVVDLQVYQLAVDVDPSSEDALDLEACGCA